MKKGAWLLALVLTGCNPAPTPLASYPQRLAAVLDTQAPALSPPLLEKGGGRAWALAVPQLTINLRQTFALRHCNLLGLIGERNAPLGKTAPPSQRLIYELTLLEGLNACHPEDSDLQALVTDLAAQKAQALPLVLWQLLAEDQAFKANWHHDRRGPGDFAGIADAQSLFSDLYRLRQGPDPKAQVRLEASLGRFASAKPLARVNQALSDARYALDAATALINNQGPKLLCVNGKPGQQARRVRDFFFSYYGKEVQPYLGRLQSADRALKESLWPLVDALPHPDLAAIPLLASPEPQSLSGQFKAAIDRHTKAWQDFLGRCGLRPGQ